MIEHLDRQGKPITYTEYVVLMRDMSYKRVAKDTVGELLVHTVWLGQDFNWGFGPTVELFETMVFKLPKDGSSPFKYPVADFGAARYATEEEALEGHREAVKWAASQP